MRLFLTLLTAILFIRSPDTFAAGCPTGKYFRKAHPRRAYVTASGVYRSATNVSSSCVEKRPGHDFGFSRIVDGFPPNWPHIETIGKWTTEERERVLEALSEIPEILWIKSIKGIYRLKKSKDFPNPSSHGRGMVVLYDEAFSEKRKLARILAHEFAHELYETLDTRSGSSYLIATKWDSMTDGRNVYWLPRKEGFVREDGRSRPGEDFANNIEYFIFEPDVLKAKSPEAFNWIKRKYGDKLSLKGKR